MADFRGRVTSRANRGRLGVGGPGHGRERIDGMPGLTQLADRVADPAGDLAGCADQLARLQEHADDVAGGPADVDGARVVGREELLDLFELLVPAVGE